MPEIMLDLDLESLDTQDANLLPDWVEFDTSKPKKSEKAIQMYRRVIECRDAIREKLNSGIHLEGKEKKIVKKEITDAVNRSENYLRESEFPNLHTFIQDTNDALARIKPKGSQRRLKPTSRSFASELEHRVKELELQLDRVTHEPLLESAILDQLGSIRQKNIRLQIENEELLEKLVEIRKQKTSLTEQIAELLTTIESLKRQVHNLGGSPTPQTPLRGV